MKSAALLALAVFASACDVRAKHLADGDDHVSINADEGGEVSFNMPFVQGQVKLPQSALADSKFDIDGVQMIPGGRTTGFNLQSAEGDTTVKMAFAASKSPDEVRSYFVDEFKRQGVAASLSGNSVTGKSKDGDAFAIDVEPASEGSKGTITIRSKD